MTAVVIKSEQVWDQKPRMPRQPKISKTLGGAAVVAILINIAFLDGLHVMESSHPRTQHSCNQKTLSRELQTPAFGSGVAGTLWWSCPGDPDLPGMPNSWNAGYSNDLPNSWSWWFRIWNMHLALLNILTSSLETLHHLVAKEVEKECGIYTHSMGHQWWNASHRDVSMRGNRSVIPYLIGILSSKLVAFVTCTYLDNLY